MLENNIAYPNQFSLSLEHLNQAFELNETADSSFNQKFMYRKAKALSMNPKQLD